MKTSIVTTGHIII